MNQEMRRMNTRGHVFILSQTWSKRQSQSMQDRWTDRCDRRRQKAKEICDKDVHVSLQLNLMEHIWRNREDFEEEDDD